MESLWGGIGIVIDAANQLVDESEIADFGRELTDWLSALRAQGDESAIVGGWISYVAGHFDNDVYERWERAFPQANVNSGFMPDSQTLHLQSYNQENVESLKDDLRSAVKYLRGE